MRKMTQSSDEEYAIYAMVHPRTRAVLYVGLSSDADRRYQEHVHSDAVWMLQLLEEKLMPMLVILESGLTLRAARKREAHWIHHYEANGHALYNIALNSVAIRGRAEAEYDYLRVYAKFAHMPEKDAHKITKMTLDACEEFGWSAWYHRFDVVMDTIKLLSKRPGFHLQLNEIDAAHITFEQFGYTWNDGEL